MLAFLETFINTLRPKNQSTNKVRYIRESDDTLTDGVRTSNDDVHNDALDIGVCQPVSVMLLLLI